MTEPVLAVGLSENRATVRLDRGEGIDADTWLQLRAEWSAGGVDSTKSIVVPLERFMALRNGFFTRCRVLGVAVSADQAILDLVARAKASRVELDKIRAEPRDLDEGTVAGLLAGTRFRRELRAFQIRDLCRLLALEHGANFSVPGAGKTTVGYAVYEAERARGRVDRLLVISPISAFDAWEEEAVVCLENGPTPVRYAGGKVPAKAEVVVTNYQRLAASYEHISGWVRDHKVMVVLDEAHRMKKGRSGEWGSACLDLAYLAVRRDILTGTPAPQGPRDFVALVDFLWPNEAIRILPADTLVPNPPADAGPRVATTLRPLFTRTNKKELDLPPVVMMVQKVELESLHREIYEAMRQIYVGQIAAMSRREAADFAAKGRIVVYLLEAATNPKLLAAGSMGDADVFRHPPLEIPQGSRLADLVANYNQYETPAKFKKLAALVEANAKLGRKTLIWSNFVRNLLALERQLGLYEPALAYGGLSAYSNDAEARTRATEITRFRDDSDCMVLLANPAALSEGISLHHACHDAIYLDRTFNAGQYLQSLDRIHRLGLDPDQETRFTFLVTNETIDEIVDARVRVKAERLGEMIDDPNLASVALPDDEDYGDVIDDPDDLVALFAHLRGDHVP